MKTTNLLLTFVFSGGPLIFWALFFFNKILAPKKLAILSLLSGIFSFPAIRFFQEKIISFFPIIGGIVQTLPKKSFWEIPIFLFIYLFIIVAGLEETIKYSILKPIITKAKKIDQIFDGIQLGILFGLGFAFGENCWIFFETLQEGLIKSFFIQTFLPRIFIPTLAHILYSALMGYYLALARFHKLYRNFLLKRAIILPIFLHGIFDFFLLYRISYLSPIILIILSLILYKWYRERRVFEIKIRKREIPPTTLFLSEKKETDVYITKEKLPFRLLKKKGQALLRTKKNN